MSFDDGAGVRVTCTYRGGAPSAEPSSLSENALGAYYVPGAIYNQIRAATSHPDIPAEERILFEAIVLRDAPAGATYADGSLRYDRLQEAGFYYLGLRDLPPPEALDEELLGGGGSPTSALVRAVEYVSRVVHEVAGAVVRGLGWIDRFLYGEVDVTVNLTVLNRDPAFERDASMLRGWGGTRDAMGNPIPLGLPGVQVQVLQWALRPTGIYPTLSVATTNGNGTAVVRAGKQQGGLGGGVDTRGTSGLCFKWKNDAAMIVAGLLETEQCDFRDAPDFENFEHDVTLDVRSDNYDAHALTQVTDTADYARAAGQELRQARILTGPVAANVSPQNDNGSKNAWTPCLRFGSHSFDAVQLGAAGLYPFSLLASSDPETALFNAVGGPWYNGQLSNSDMVMPRYGPQRFSRAYMVHEFGHFIQCSLMYKFEPSSLSLLALDTLLEGANPVEANDGTRIQAEAFADFITAQVTGGSMYFTPVDTTNSGSLDYCNGLGPCLEVDRRGSGNGGEQIARTATLFHDAFDGNVGPDAVPTNGDSFVLEAAPSGFVCDTPTGACLRPAFASYGFDVTEDDVQLPASALDDIFFWALTEESFIELPPWHELPLMQGLGLTMFHHGFNWCQMCEVFARHSPDLPGSPTLRDMWEVCALEPFDPFDPPPPGTPIPEFPIRAFIPLDPPDGDLRIAAATCEPCPPGEVSDANGQCSPCPLGSVLVGNACSACPPGTTSQGNECVPCPGGIVIDNVCESLG